MANGNGNGNEGLYSQPSIPKFDGHYDHWSMLMENFMRSKEYWSLLENDVLRQEEGTPMTDALQKQINDSKLKDLKAKNYLFQAIDRTILESISDESSSKGIWDAMKKKKYQGTTRVKKSILQGLRKEFETLEMKTGENASEYVSRVMTIANKMRIHSESLKDGIIVEKILRSL